MKACEGRIGRVFVIRLEDGDAMPDCVEQFAAENGINAGFAHFVGGVGGGELVVGPRDSAERPPHPLTLPIDGAHEVVASGVLAPDETGKPILHMHAALGRAGTTMTGCIRKGVKTWLVGEVLLYEVLDADVARLPDAQSGFHMLEPRGTVATPAPAAAPAPAAVTPQEPPAAAPAPATAPVTPAATEEPETHHAAALYMFNAKLN